jgi:hypothetical protein
MKIQFTPKRVRLVRVAIALVAISLAGYVAYAASQLSINNTGSVVNVGTNLFASLQGTVNPVTCTAATTPAYTDTGLAQTWSVPVATSGTSPGSQTQYACVENTGSSAHVIAITETGALPTGVTFTSTGSGSNIVSGGFQLVSFTLTDSSTTNANTALTFTITIT